MEKQDDRGFSRTGDLILGQQAADNKIHVDILS
jgi:hypothetical protein